VHFQFLSGRRRRALLSVSSLLLLAAAPQALAQSGNSATSPAVATPEPSASPPAATPAPAPAPEVAPAAQAGENVLPTTRVSAPVQRPRPRRPQAAVATGQPPAPTQQQATAQQNDRFDSARRNIFPPVGASAYEMTRQAIEALPQGTNAGLDKVLLQMPGVTQDSAASGELHVRNEHGNLQFRINGVQLPDGVAGGFAPFLDSGIVGNMSLVTGALPAQYGLRTAGVLDIQTRSDAFDNSGKISLYGGSHQTITPYAEYGGTIGQTQYYVSGRYLYNNLGIENPTPANTTARNRKRDFCICRACSIRRAA